MLWSTSTVVKEFRSMILLGESTFFLVGRNLSTVNGRFSKLTLGSSTATWSKSMQWPNMSWTFQESSTVMSADSTLIYTLISYGSPAYLIFSIFKSSNGGISGSRYISNIICGEAFDLYLKDDLVYLLSLWGAGYTFTAFDTTTSTFGAIYKNTNFLNTFIEQSSEAL